MMKTNYFLILAFLAGCLSAPAQYGKQKKADKLYEELAYFEAVDVYHELIENNYNTTRNKQRLADTYIMLRSPENAVKYYEDIVEEAGISPEYYYKYAQALRGVKRYDESKEWLQKYLDNGGKIQAANETLKEDTPGVNTTYRMEKAAFNSEMSDFGVFEENGKIYFVSARAEGVAEKDRVYSWTGEPYLDIYELNTETQKVTAIPGEVNTRLHDGPAVVSPNGKTMYFTRNNFNKNREGKRDKNATNHLKIYSAKLTENGWQEIKELPINSDEYSVGHPALSPDGGTLYFTSDMPGGSGGTDLYRVAIKDGSFGDPENLGSRINTERDENFPFIDEDGVLYFSSNGRGGLGLFDIFKILPEDKTSEVENLGEPVNSNLDDFAFFKSKKNNTGYISSNRDEKSDNIYQFKKLEPLQLKGMITDVINGNPIGSATIRIFDRNKNQIAFLETDARGNFETTIERDREFPLEAKQIEYETFNAVLNTGNSDELDEIEYNIGLHPIKDVEYLAEIDMIYFDFDKSTIREDAARELDKLVALMQNEYPELVIEISAHTDVRGSEEYNEGLAEKRAKVTRDYLVSHGIAKDRIKAAKGFGEREPALECVRCSEEEHQLNRRSMFKVVEMN